MANKSIDVFLRNVEGEKKNYGSKSLELAKEAEKLGIRPCEICKIVDDPEKCNIVQCYPWYDWFKKCWKSIQADAKEKGIKNDKL